MFTDILNYTPAWVAAVIAMQLVTMSFALSYFMKSREVREQKAKVEKTLEMTILSLRSVAMIAQAEIQRQRHYILAACQYHDVREWLSRNVDDPITEAPAEILIKLTSFPTPHGPHRQNVH